MSVVSRQELAREVSRRYARATRPEKSRILDEFVATMGYNRMPAMGLRRRPHHRSTCLRRRSP